MRRKDREITDPQEIFNILQRCDTAQLGMCDADAPYVVPVSFGVAMQNGMPVVYFHCAKHGKKLDLLRENPAVCLTASRFLGVQQTAHGITTRYESVIGTGHCSVVTDPEELTAGMQTILAHYDYSDYPLARCGGWEHMYLMKIPLSTLSGKHNLPEA